MKHLFKLLMVFCMAVAFLSAHAQNAIPATGANATGSGGSASYTIGQVAFSTLTGVSGTITEGVQQPFEISVVSAVDDTWHIQLTCVVYPNPVSDFLTLKIKEREIKNMSYLLFGINGNLFETKEIIAPETAINMQNQVSGTYYLKIISGKRELKTFKIIKN